MRSCLEIEIGTEPIAADTDRDFDSDFDGVVDSERQKSDSDRNVFMKTAMVCEAVTLTAYSIVSNRFRSRFFRIRRGSKSRPFMAI